jgi:hypothetical protein
MMIPCRETDIVPVVEWDGAAMPHTCVEVVPVSDTYADDIAYVENLGGNVRVVYFTWATVDGRKEKVITAKIVRPASSLKAGRISQLVEDLPDLGLLAEPRGH